MKLTEEQLYGWVNNQRQFYRMGKLDERKIKLLEALPGWSWNLLDARFQRGYDHTLKHGVVTPSFVTPDGYKLGQWQLQRRHAEDDPERRKLLEAIPGWSWNPLDDEWNKGIALSKSYGTVPPQFLTECGYALGRWQYQQRALYKDKAKKLNPERIKMIESIKNWTWTYQNDIFFAKWERGYHLTKKHGIVLTTDMQGNFPLGSWQKIQRSRCKDPMRRSRLEKIPGWFWDYKEAAWQNGYTYTKRYGVVPSKFRTKDGFALGSWQGTQRQDCKDRNKRNLLSKIKGWYWKMTHSQAQQLAAKARRKAKRV
jgi:hypothetical protein